MLGRIEHASMALVAMCACTGDPPPAPLPEPWPASIHTISDHSFEMVRIRGGSFTMGRPAPEEGWQAGRDAPEHPVTLTRPFFLGREEVSQGLWTAVIGWNPSAAHRFEHGRTDEGLCTAWALGDHLPVYCITWPEAVAFCNRLSALADLQPAYTEVDETFQVDTTANGYRLPTEAEWEYASLTTASYSAPPAGSSGVAVLPAAERSDAPSSSAEPVLRNMAGAIWEWTWDWYRPYTPQAQTDPLGPDEGDGRVIRGGGWNHVVEGTHHADRGRDEPYYRGRIGLRLARTAAP